MSKLKTYFSIKKKNIKINYNLSMKIVVGLGNPGKKYENNRHNVGFMFINYIAPLLHCSIVEKNKYYLAMKQSNNRTIIFIKPQTFMNQSGLAVKKLITNYQLPITNLYVIHDDLDIPLGKFKIQKGVGPKLHNGIESIEKELATKDFWRVRIGVDNRQNRQQKQQNYLCDDRIRTNFKSKWVDGETYVLQDFEKEEKEILTTQVFPKVFERLSRDLIL